jgi:septum formation protein
MNGLPDLVLASTSPYRRTLLDRLRIRYETIAPTWEEVRIERDPDATVRANALGKARSGSLARPGAAVLGSDQVAWCSGKLLESPGSPERAAEQLAWLAGREHTLHTCVALRMPDGQEATSTVVAHLWMRPLTQEQIDSYIRHEDPVDCAGSYKFESLGIVLFDRIACEDPTAIQGLPLIATRRLLESAGWRLP